MNLFTGLTLIFAIAKLTGYLSWSWWLVFAPTILQVLIVGGILTLGITAKIASEW